MYKERPFHGEERDEVEKISDNHWFTTEHEPLPRI